LHLRPRRIFTRASNRYAYGPTWMYGAHRLGFRR
jgi:hypothetical protein